jgi:hypothetical protein
VPQFLPHPPTPVMTYYCLSTVVSIVFLF